MAQPPTTEPQPRTCPLLGIESIDTLRSGAPHRPGEPVEYPSFENRCWASGTPVGILLTDQATLCLCPAYRQCPRFAAARAARQGQAAPQPAPPPADADSLSQALDELEADVAAAGLAQTRSRRRWGWIGAGLIFVSSLLCGGFFAAYVGWQMVSSEFTAAPPGTVDTLAAAPAAAPQVFMIVTATSAPPSLPATGGDPAVVAVDPAGSAAAAEAASATEGSVYPQAVAPTPQSATVALVPGTPPPSFAEIAQAANLQPQPQVQMPASTPIFDMALTIPTRRPTPELGIPTSTEMPLVPTPTLPPTPTPQPLGTPWVVFAAEDEALEQGKCTTVSWRVENVRAVYYENQGVDGIGEIDECMRDKPGDYNLLVIMPDGASRTYTVTVDLIRPTETPAPTPTFTDVPEPTPTWTPNIPTPTPTPPTLYGVRLEAGDSTEITCARGTTCDIDFYVTNTGDGIDTLTLRFTEMSSWRYQLCRLDGVCATDKMNLVNMGPSSTGVVRFSVSVPEDALSETLTYRLQAVSEQSGGERLSDQVTVRVTPN